MDEIGQLEELKNQDWKTIIPRATNYVLNKLKITVLLKGSKQFARGTEAKEIVFKAIELLFTGERKWNKEVHPEIFQHLISTINSLVNEHHHSFESEKRLLVNDNNDGIDSDSFWEKFLNDSSPQELTEYQEVFDECLKIVENEPDLPDLLLYMIADYDRTEIAKMMNKSIKEIDNMKKRLRRKLNNELSVRKVGIPR
ncbi:MAG: hypothetical protein HXY50_06525 [Ignavibacteriaceae bacterium]|nr:hypothetical protein [Ignavibacteriaceae bacterium]